MDTTQSGDCHVALTGSTKGAALLAAWEHALPRFWKVAPRAALEQATAAARAVEEEAAAKVAD